jgi:hypothetical protein
MVSGKASGTDNPAVRWGKKATRLKRQPLREEVNKMKHLTILILCLFLTGIAGLTFAADPAQVKQPEQKIDTEAAEEGELIQEAREFPTTFMREQEERYRIMQEVEELQEQYRYDEDLSE